MNDSLNLLVCPDLVDWTLCVFCHLHMVIPEIVHPSNHAKVGSYRPNTYNDRAKRPLAFFEKLILVIQ